MKWFKRKAEEPTFKSKVETFWSWWGRESDRLYAALEASGGREIQAEISQAVHRLYPGLAWVFGPGENRVGHSLTMSPEGDRNALFLTSYWRTRAPVLDGWSFYSTRQAQYDLSSLALQIGGVEVTADSIRIRPEVDLEGEKVHVVASGECFAALGEERSGQALFLLLDEALGEDGVERFLGRIEIGRESSVESIPLTELSTFVRATAEENSWPSAPPEQTFFSYSFREPLGDFPRGDTIAGTTRNLKIVEQFVEAKGRMKDPLPGSGAEYLYVELAADLFPAGEEVKARGEIEVAIEDRLVGDESGMLLGGAFGRTAGWVDLVVFDGERSRELIRLALDERDLSSRYRIIPFAR